MVVLQTFYILLWVPPYPLELIVVQEEVNHTHLIFGVVFSCSVKSYQKQSVEIFHLHQTDFVTWFDLFDIDSFPLS